jgi:hypothetical protein
MFRTAVRVIKTTKEDVGEIYMQPLRPSTAYCISCVIQRQWLINLVALGPSAIEYYSNCGTSNFCHMNTYERSSDSSECIRQLVDKYFYWVGQWFLHRLHLIQCDEIASQSQRLNESDENDGVKAKVGVERRRRFPEILSCLLPQDLVLRAVFDE